MFTPRSRACVYKNASGQGKWPNQDPIGELGGLNLYGYVGNDPVNQFDPFGLDAAIINHGGYTGHTSLAIIQSDGSVKAYHFYALSHQTGKSSGLGSLLAVGYDKVSVWSETAASLQAFLLAQQKLGGDVSIEAYALGTSLDDELALEELTAQDKADAGFYSLALGVECHKKSWEWFNEYREGGPKINAPPLASQAPPINYPKQLFQTRRFSQEVLLPIPGPVLPTIIP